jgi:hypothetical protein
MSGFVHRQSVRPPPIGIAIEGRINPRASQFSVLKDTPINAAALSVLYVFFMAAPFPALEGH